MAAGFQVSLQAANNQAAQLVINLRSAFQQIQEYQTWLASVGAAGLEAAPISMASADANVLISAFNDLNDLAGVYFNGTSAAGHLTGTYQYTQFAKQLTAYS